MGTNKNILEKSAEVKGFVTKPWIFKGKPDMRARDRYDEPCLKYVREMENNRMGKDLRKDL